MESFLEELIVRRELSDNYCHYEVNYDNLLGAAQWAQDTLAVHAGDKREYVYTRHGGGVCVLCAVSPVLCAVCCAVSYKSVCPCMQ